MLYKNLGINEKGHLTIGGTDAVALAAEYGTPLYVLDEDIIKENASLYISALKKYAPEGSMPFFASKACSFRDLYRIIGGVGMGTDLVSPGEIYTALTAGFDMRKTIFHGNNKTDADIVYAMENGVGYFATDTFEEIEAADRIAGKLGIKQDILLRITPGIDAHTHKAITTGNIDSKFGFPIFSGDAAFAAKLALSKKNLSLKGIHCHIGSQITELQPFLDASDVMLGFIKSTGIPFEILNLGGGFGVAYAENETALDIAEGVKALCGHIKEKCGELGITVPKIFMEPGRSVVANAGTTLYTAGSVKIIPGIKNYVSIDGGMTDNPRFALYKSVYTCVLANKMNEKTDFVCSVAGRCCESGDLIQEGVLLPRPCRGDIMAVFGTGAYNFSMSSNYNRLCRPATVILSGGKPRIAIKRESFEHLTELEI